jgi:hypothetical protein
MANLINLSQVRQDQLVNAINTPINTATGLLYQIITGQQLTSGQFDSRYVKNTGNEPVSGVKAFVNRPTFANTGLLASGEKLSLSQTGSLYPSGNVSGFTPISVTGSNPVLNATFSGVGGAQVILSGNSMILVSGGAGTSVGGAGSGVSLLVATGSINSGGFTGNVLLSGAGDVTITTGDQAQRVIVISGNTGAYANFVTVGNTTLVRSIQTTGNFPSGIVSGSVVISGAGVTTVTTGAAGQIVISGDGVKTLQTTGAYPSGSVSGNVLVSGAGSVSVTTGVNGNLIVVSGTAGSANTGELTGVFYPLTSNPAGYISNTGLVTGLVTGIRNDVNFFFPVVITGTSLQEAFTSTNFTTTGWAIGCINTGRGGAHFTSGASGAILQYPLSGRFLQRATGGSTSLISNFSFDSGLLYKELLLPNTVLVTGRNRVGIDIFSGLSGIAGVTFSIFGFY